MGALGGMILWCFKPWALLVLYFIFGVVIGYLIAECDRRREVVIHIFKEDTNRKVEEEGREDVQPGNI